MFAVASSRITILLRLKIERQIQISYFSPADRLLPFSSIFKSKPDPVAASLRCSKSFKPALNRTSLRIASGSMLKGSRLNLNVPLKIVGS
jgi:hypothetical protein